MDDPTPHPTLDLALDPAPAIDAPEAAEALAVSPPAAATYSVSEVNAVIRNALRAALPGEVWVTGEIQSYKVSGAGHAYFQLVEKAPRAERVVSCLDVVLFRDERAAVDRALQEVGLRLGADVGVRVRGRIDHYAKSGRLQLRMIGIDPVFTVGGMAEQRQRLLRALHADGLLRANAGRSLVAVPLRVALVASRDSAGYHDFVHELEVSGYAWRVACCDVRVQGDGAAKRLVWGLREVARRAASFDVAVVIRGGGSRSDLAPFDAEAVARAIAAFPVPVVTGIGHETDRSVADEVAHTACKTPTACAQELVGRVGGFVARLDTVSTAVVARARGRSDLARRELAEHTSRVGRGAPAAAQRAHVRVGHDARRVGELARHRLRDGERSLAEQRRRAATSAPRGMRAVATALDGFAARVRALDPARVLERGYSITRDDQGRALTTVAMLEPGGALHTELAGGGITSRIETLTAVGVVATAASAGATDTADTAPPVPDAEEGG